MIKTTLLFKICAMVCETLKKVESDIFQNTSSGRETSRFTAKELDDETGLYYYRARYMNPMKLIKDNSTLKRLLVIAVPMIVSQASDTIMLFVDRLFLS
ncbi:MAG: hypothetical protein U9N32_01260, partial [Spirochaetota bacterium]|nr:hypothetical protein [Spirochaetota bacterium]